MRRGIQGSVAGIAVAAGALAGSVVSAQPSALDAAGIDRLMRESGGRARVSLHPATGAARFVRLAPGDDSRASNRPGVRGATTEAGFFRRYGSLFGIRDFGGELRQVGQTTDELGRRHSVYAQFYRGVPVFAGTLKVHVDAAGHLYAVNGTFVPGLDLSVEPSRTAKDASAVALAKVAADKPQAKGIQARSSRLLVFREGLVKGVEGPNRLVWEVEVGNGGDVREFVYVDARNGKFVDQYTGIHDALNRRAFDGQNNPAAVPPTYPGTPFWLEGDTFPSTGSCVQGAGLPNCNGEADNVILGSQEAYDFFNIAFGRDSIDGAGAVLDGIFDRGNACPNASWNGTFTSYCPGITGDDTVSHEWGHAYTQFTHNLIYAWQPGALNESYSDIWGETVDLINGRGLDAPGTPRTAGTCSSFQRRGQLRVNTPGTIAGVYQAQPAQFGPPLSPTGITGDVVVGLDPADGAGPSTTDGCSALTNPVEVAGKIALIDRGTCTFVVKVTNAQAAGAIGVIVANNAAAGLPGMGGNAPAVTIPSLGVQQATGTAIKTELVSGTVNATLQSDLSSADDSVRWLASEDDPGFGGAIRDMWNPSCFGDPGRVGDTAFYTCSTADGGGVHTNSGVPNHGFALVVDGGTYNGHTVTGLGLTKAAHIYYRAMRQYQVSDTDFADHADALETSCNDLIGFDLASLTTGLPSGEIISAADCGQVTEAIAAVELRTPPTFCNFQPLLAQNPPPRCAAGQTQVNVFLDTFESGIRRRRSWTTSEQPVTPADFTPRSWERVTNLPDGRSGYAMFGPNPDIGGCAPGSDESAVLRAVSPQFRLTGTAPFLVTFDHWVATEGGWDGGILEVSVNGGAWTQVPAANFTYNAYNTTLQPAPGNTNPLAGRAAFSGTDGGSVGGTWGRSHANLTGVAAAGDAIRLRLSIGNDGCTGAFGWYVDDVTVYRCQP